jgi:hypothetical protein
MEPGAREEFSMNTVEKLEEELKELAGRVGRLTAREKELLGERSLFGLELLIERTRASVHLVTMGRPGAIDTKQIERFVEVAKSRLDAIAEAGSGDSRLA